MAKRGSPNRVNPILNVFKDMFMYGLETFGRYYANYRGFVYDVKDPNGMGRLKLIIPEVGGDTPFEYWAYPKNIFSGPGYGMQLLPQKGDVVWVEFEGGHPEVPIWSLGHFGKGEVPTDIDLDDTNCYWFKTPKGHLIKVNDTKSYIEIQHTGGQIARLDDTAISLISNKAISLGSKDSSSQPALLGNDTKAVLQSMIDFCDSMALNLFKDTITLMSYAPNTISNVPNLFDKVGEMKAHIEKVLSQINTLD